MQIEKWKISLNLVYSQIVKLNSLLGRPTCKEQKYLSKDFIYLHYWRGHRIVNFSEKINFFNIRDGPSFHWTFFVRNKFLSNIQPLDFAKKQLMYRNFRFSKLQNPMAGYYSETYFLQKMFYWKTVHLQYRSSFFQRNSKFCSSFNNGDR